MDTYTYADGYGRWHVLTRDTPRGLTRAIDAIVGELFIRREGTSDESVREYVNRHIASLPLSEWETSPAYGGTPIPPGAWLHFAEYAID
jgi:hypothetical protein